MVGGLSLTAVAMALYLSPIGTNTPVHARLGATASEAGASTNHSASHGHSAHAAQAKAGAKAPTVKLVSSKQIVRQLVPVPSAAKSPSATTTTSSPPASHTPTSTQTSTPPTAATFTVQTKANLLAPSTDYWGVSINGVPQGTSQLNALDSEVGEAPSELTWYQGWDAPYPVQTVQSSWQHGALPMITWESKPSIDTTPAQSDPLYSLSDIINGNYDAYLQTFAQSVASTGLPVVIRLDQEMNGNWFPWSEGVNGNRAGQFVQMWQHVWNIFQAAGANSDVIWLWAVNRVDNLTHGPSLSELYPGNSYVDWVGVDAYWRYATEAPTYAAVFGQSMTAVAAVTNKPVYIAETAGIETNVANGDDVGPQKIQFTSSLISSIESDPQIVGFSWFNNVASSTEDNVPITNDWRIDSNPANLLAFKQGLAAGPFSTGLMPSAGPPVQLAVVPPGGP